LALLGDFLVSAILLPLQWIAVALLQLAETSDRIAGTSFTGSFGDRPDWYTALQGLVELKPNLAGVAAGAIDDSSLDVDPVMSTGAAWEELKNAIAEGMKIGMENVEIKTDDGFNATTN